MTETAQVDLVVTGMTCASCAHRIERKLNKLDGVEASVNYATGIARVTYAPTIVMDQLITTVEQAGYNAIAPNPLLDEQVAAWEKAHERDLFQRWLVGALFAIPTALIAMVEPLQFDGWGWTTVLLSVPVVLWTSWPLHVASFRNAAHRATTMDTLVSIGIIAAFISSIYELIAAGNHHTPHLYIDVAVIVPVFVVLGRWLEARNKSQAGSALRALADATPKFAIKLVDGNRIEAPIDTIQVGDIVVVAPESTVPVDGRVHSGQSSVSNALLTGESMPAFVESGAEISAGALNHEGELTVEVTAVGSGSQIARIASLVAAAQSGKANIARLADRISAIFVPVVLGIALATGGVWFFIDQERVIEVVLAVLIIACPCALGLATPTALVVGSGRAATLGFLVAGPQVFENSRRIDAVVFDKTGTLTLGEMAVTSHTADVSHQALLKSIASKSSHPVAVAVAREFSQADEVELAGVLAVPGKGVRATWNGVIVEFGSRNFHPEIQLDSIGTTSWLFIDNKAVASVQVSDTLDPSSAHTVARLQAMGVEVHMASGDVASVADAVAKELNITHVHSQLTPDDKIAIIQNLQAEGKIVAMVGDGSNDAPALAQADIGIAMGRGTGIARATADITLLRPDLNLIPTSLRLSAATLRTIKQNLGWAFGYNIAAIPLAMTGNLNPMIAGIAMSASSVLVVTNSLRLRKRNFS